MDYDRLRQQGLRLLGRLAGQQWTDFNAHDPGVTILEQLCYAITDLGYRIDYPIPDLLADSDESGLPGPAEILTCDPVTRDDLRKLVIDAAGTDSAAVVDPVQPALELYYHEASGELRLQPDAGDIAPRPIQPRGLHHVLLQTTDQLSGDAALDLVAARLHRGRLLGEDFEVDRFGVLDVELRAGIEIEPVEDPVALLADIIESIERCLAPPPRFVTLAEARARGQRIDELFEGPKLEHDAFVDHLPAPRRSVYVSALVRAIIDVPQARAVRWIEPRAVEIPPGMVAKLSSRSELALYRAGLPIRADLARALDLVTQRRSSRSRQALDERALQPPAGRSRALARYRSLQRQMPAAYGVGPLGLPGSAPAQRRAQARQLEAYLLMFDQLLANEFAQLAHAHELLSPDTGDTRTYFAQPVVDPPLGLHELFGGTDETSTPEALRAWLDENVEMSSPTQRRKRFLAHLLARFAEQLGDDALIRTGDEADPSDDADHQVVVARQTFLQNYPRLSGARGSGYDLREDTASGLEERLRLQLGWSEPGESGTGFYLVEHILLRPLPEDRNQLDPTGEAPVPLLAGVDSADPWSHQVSFVFEAPAEPDEGHADARFEDFVAQTILAEAPAHLDVHLHWFDSDPADGAATWADFADAWAAFRAGLRAYRWPHLAGASAGPVERHLRARDARDRVIDLLGLGRTYPLRDVPFPSRLLVAPDASTDIELAYSQRDVIYTLCGEGGLPVELDGAPIARDGTGGTLLLPTPPVEEDVSYQILATKREGAATEARREAWLHGSVRLEEGVDPRLVAQLRLPLLDPSVDDPKPDDTRIADYHAQVEVELHDSQEGVLYELLDVADHARVLSEPVIGTSGTIVLTCGPVTEDIDLCVRGTRESGEQDDSLRTAVLDTVLPLRVRANPGLTAALTPAIVAHGGTAALELSSTQENIGYRVWQRPIEDLEVVFDEPSEFTTIDVADGDRIIRVRRPETSAVWEALAGFEPHGESRAGTGGALSFALDASERDAMVLVQAIKQHRNGPLSGSGELLESAVPLDRALALLVRPNHAQPVRVLAMAGGDADGDQDPAAGPLLVRDGQPGVFYELRLDEADDPLDRPAYFHPRDPDDPTRHKGVGQVRLEVDAVVARDDQALPSGAPAPAADQPHLEPLLDAELAPGTTLHLRARAAMTGLEADLVHPVVVEPGDPEPSP